MKLTQKQQELLINKFNTFWIDRKCEICGRNDWTIDDSIFEIREFHGPTTVLGNGLLKPFITVSCQNCTNTKLFNAINLGLIDGEGN